MVKWGHEEAEEAKIAVRLDGEHPVLYCEDADGWSFCLTCGNTACDECKRRHANRHPWCDECHERMI
ncbi:hypothetical protein AB0F18_33925 [Streptomyces sp. NPDC029216]|uniref:hypothetical protein n=1 Tax=Streptomyces sp. NPDC029216 TaxID=3154701 RepID=UPI0033F6911A